MKQRLKSRNFELAMLFISVPVDLALIILSAYAAYTFRQNFGPVSEGAFMPLAEYLFLVVYMLPLFVLVFFINGIYSTKPKGLLTNINNVTVAVSVVFMIIFALLFLTRTFFFSRLVIVYAWIITIVLVCFGKAFVWFVSKYLYRMKLGINLVVIVGTDNIAKVLTRCFSGNGLGNRKVIAYVDIKNRISTKKLNDVPTVKRFSELSNKIDMSDVSEIIWTEKGLDSELAWELVNFCQDEKIRFRYVPNLFATRTTNINLTTVSGVPIIELRKTPLEGWGRISKRIFDILGSLFGLIVCSPLFLLIAVLIKLDSKGSVLFTQDRVGEHEKFKIYKFRTMVEDASKLLSKIRQKVGDTGPFYNVKIKNDPRLTRVGKFLRKTSIDELPQLYNILLGEMSLVGPRPLAPKESYDVERYEKRYRIRRYVKPGITGLWQVSGRSEMTTRERISLDIYYAEHWSLLLDIQIIIKTFWIVISKKGAK